MKFFSGSLSILFMLLALASCKNEPKASTGTEKPAVASKSSADVSTLEVLDHDFNITPEGSRLFFKGFFNNQLVNAAMTINKGKLHVKSGLISGAEFNLDLKTLEQVANRNEATVTFMKGEKAFETDKYLNGKFTITECTKAVNDQNATHNLKGTIDLHGHTVPFGVGAGLKARIDYSHKNISIISDQIIIKASDLGIKMADLSQDNIYFSLTLNGTLL